MKTIFISLIIALTSVSSFAEDRVRDVLKDPASGMFKEVQTFPNGNSCGLVNAKNVYGGYVGFQAYKVVAGDVHINHSPLEWNCKTAEDPKWDYARRCEASKQQLARSTARMTAIWSDDVKKYCTE